MGSGSGIWIAEGIWESGILEKDKRVGGGGWREAEEKGGKRRGSRETKRKRREAKDAPRLVPVT